MTLRAISSAGHAQRILSCLVLGALMVACSGDRATGGGAPSAASNEALPRVLVTDSGLDAYFYCRDPQARRKAVIILGGSEGGKHWSTNTEHVRRLLDHGYSVMVLAYFGTPGLPRHLREIPIEYFEKAFRWLDAQPGVVPEDYALIGGSRGGELALLLASRYSQVRAVVAIDPASVMFPSPPTGFFDALWSQHSAWAAGGRPLAFAHVPLSFAAVKGIVTGRQRRMFELALRDDRAVEAATIPVEKANGPVLCISNLRDETWPSAAMCDQIEARLASRAFPFAHERASFDEIHYTVRLETCWETILQFLDRHFQSNP